MSLESQFKHVVDNESGRSLSTHPREVSPLTPKRLRWLRLQESKCLARVACALDESDAKVAILSRRGSNLDVYRFDTETPHYTHMAFAVRVGARWYLDHLLNTHSGPEGQLYRQPLADFVRDDPFEYHVGIMVPSIELQQRVVDVLASPVRQWLYQSRYSCIAYPFATRFQSSNQWLLEVVGAAQSGLTDRASVQKFLRENGLKPTVMHLNLAKQIAAPFVTRNTSVNDQPLNLRAKGRVGFLTEPSIRSYLEETDRINMNVRVTLDDQLSVPMSQLPVAA